MESKYCQKLLPEFSLSLTTKFSGPATPGLTCDTHNFAIGNLRAVMPGKAMLRGLGAHCTIIAMPRRRFRTTGSVDYQHHSGSPRATTAAQNRLFVRLHVVEPFRTALKIPSNIPSGVRNFSTSMPSISHRYDT